MKLYDFDGMFDEKLGAYIQKHASEHTESEWEDIIPRMYAKFGDTPIKRNRRHAPQILRGNVRRRPYQMP